MPSQRVSVWGLVNNSLFTGQQCSDSNTAALVQAGGWNPDFSHPQKLVIPGVQAKQLAVGWNQAVWLLSNGQAYTRPSCTLTAAGGSALEAASEGQVVCQSSSVAEDVGDQQQQLQQQESSLLPSTLDCRGWQQLQLRLSSDPPWPLLHPTPAPGAQQQVVQVAAGDHHCLLLTASGSVWSYGDNTCGQLGCVQEQHGQQEQQQQHTQQQQEPVDGPLGLVAQPLLVLGPGADGCVSQEPMVQVAAGACHSAAVTASLGQLYCWGWNGHGQCCTGGTSNVLQPQLCSALDGVPLVAAAAGMAHTVCVSRDGAVYACGWNLNGQLGTGQELPQRQQQQQQPQQQQPELLSLSAVVPQLVEAPGLDQEHAVQVACGSRHTLALSRDGAVWAWGWNKYGQCCVFGGASDVLQPRRIAVPAEVGVCKAAAVHAGRWHSCIAWEGV